MVELKFNVQKQNIKVFKDAYSEADCERKAQLAREKAFGVMSRVAKLFDKVTRIELTHKEKKYYPFWHINAESFMEYLRANSYSFPVEPQVRTVKIAGNVFEVSKDSPVCNIEGEDYCVENYTKEEIRDATEAAMKEKKLTQYLKFETKTIKQTEELMGRNVVVFPASVRGAYIIREMMKDLLKPVHADKILTEKIEVTEMCLYFRPAYAFEFTKRPSGKTGVLEVDAITGEMYRSNVVKSELREMIPEDTLFELGAEVASMVIPGVSTAAVIGKQIHAFAKKKSAIKQMKVSQAAMASKSVHSTVKKKSIRLH